MVTNAYVTRGKTLQRENSLGIGPTQRTKQHNGSYRLGADAVHGRRRGVFGSIAPCTFKRRITCFLLSYKFNDLDYHVQHSQTLLIIGVLFFWYNRKMYRIYSQRKSGIVPR